MNTEKCHTTNKAIILGAGRGIASGLHHDPLPICLIGDSFGTRVIDWLLNAFYSIGIEEPVFVGGYRIGEIASRYNRLKYILNPDWQHTGVLESLNKAASEITGPLFVSYADIVFSPNTCKQILNQGSEWITIAVDSKWKTHVDEPEGKIRKNMVVLDNEYVSDVGFLPVGAGIDAEFIGLVYFGPKIIPLLVSFFQDEYLSFADKQFYQADEAQKAFLTDLFRYFLQKNIEIKAVDIGSDWAEMDSPKQLAQFVLGTKAQTLERLSTIINKAKFCKQILFTVAQWQSNKESVLNDIMETFSSFPIVIRSSAIVEDSWTSSCAGSFTSILDVTSTDRGEIELAVQKVIQSYMKGGLQQSGENQVLVQEMVQDVVKSGVVFTRDLETGAPYYIINYDESNKTDAVTSGSSNNLKTLFVNRSCPSSVHDPNILSLLEVVQDIETKTGSSALDIEFAINADNEIYILQTRPLTCVSDEETFSLARENKQLDNIRDLLRLRFSRDPYLYGETTILGDMPDWNPVEMIGANPRPLALSMYHYLITNSAWRIARSRIGYNHPEHTTLMCSIGGKPYIDVRSSFNSFLPAQLNPDLSEKLVNHYIQRLNTFPVYHDKVEFEVLITCLDFDFDNKAKRLADNGFSSQETEELRKGLFVLTDDIVSGRVESIEKLNKEIEKLYKRLDQVLTQDIPTAKIPIVIGKLLDDCIQYGTIPFSILARYGFIATTFLKSLVARGVFTKEEQQAFLHSIETVATEFMRDMNSVNAAQIPLSDFLIKYGHLRPGTYDINCFRYDERPEFYFPVTRTTEDFANTDRHEPNHAEFDSIQTPPGVDKPLNSSKKEACISNTSPHTYCTPKVQGINSDVSDKGYKRFELSPQKLEDVEKLIAEIGFSFSAERLFEFMRQAITSRESGKFNFTKIVSSILMLLEKFGDEYEFSRDDMSFVNIEQVRLWGINIFPCDYKEMLQTEINSGRHRFEHSKRVKLPHLITKPEDIDVIELEASRPNFVTLKQVTGKIQFVDNDTPPSLLNNKIVLIEGADPGFDWIFAHGIKGLITKYGGAASHMTIRTAEFEIPAAIGCGEYTFERIKKASSITLDCSTETIHVV